MRNTKKSYSSFLKKAGDRNLEVSLSYEQYYRLKVGNCHYCLMPYERLALYYEKLGLKTPYMTIDRKDNFLGYHLENCVSCCFNCNRIKGSFFSSQEMERLAEQFIRPKIARFDDEVWEEYSQIIAMGDFGDSV